MADFPLAAAAGTEIFQGYDEGFEEGLRLVIAGIAARYGSAETLPTRRRVMAGRPGRVGVGEGGTAGSGQRAAVRLRVSATSPRAWPSGRCGSPG
jgi:hypothetical protein